MKQKHWVALFLAFAFWIGLFLIPSETLTYNNTNVIAFTPVELGIPLEIKAKPTETADAVRAYLEKKNSPLAPHTELLLKQEHWKLIVAISAIESSYCTRQLGNNCWGITGSSGGYKEYASVADGIEDANALITRWQARGRWLTVDDMNCHYVVPCNPNWVSVVNTVLNRMESYERD